MPACAGLKPNAHDTSLLHQKQLYMQKLVLDVGTRNFNRCHDTCMQFLVCKFLSWKQHIALFGTGNQHQFLVLASGARNMSCAECLTFSVFNFIVYCLPLFSYLFRQISIHASACPCSVSIFRTLRIQGCWASVDETWHIYILWIVGQNFQEAEF